ncbi:glutathione-disulfide reductase [Sphingobium jiangsuense]|uniref:Glutathione reductase (NADPH) n=1 Tax=Sphingobium jiangsuense TaxID=870476 RepID=A0A7W6FQS9_9SPHN|nr:glutathione-disulfide reductase [Sphingobium jiangsuense]MBB3927446.1 glutathione reductase (NADPH) [Sphingobium jiangsuense]GLT01170.1 glutathione-disulfide reductase [Sphingobium jiangsuense]
MSEFDFDLFVIGAGSGGVRASRIAASHGARVAVAEEYRVGGTCVIRGCVPKKMLVYGAHFAEDLHAAARFGWTLEGVRFDWKTLRDNVLADVDRLNGLYQQTLDGNKVTTFHERARISGPHEVTLASGRKVSAGTILIATGSWPMVPEVEGAEHGITSNEVFHLESLPKRVAIAGGGYIANEFAGIFNALGCDVTIVNRSDRILRGYDDQIVDRLKQLSEAKGITFRLDAPFERIEKAADGTITIHVKNGEPIECDLLVFAVGRKPMSFDLGLEEVGVALSDKGAVIVDEHSRTNIPSIHAVGDVTDRVQLTPVAIREGHAFADTVFGGTPRTVDYGCIPSAVFSNPPLAGVGLTEEEARRRLGEVKVYTSDFRPMKNALTGNPERSLYKMICDGATGRVVGVHMISPEAPEILQVVAVAVKAGLTKQQFDDTVALHPSMAEELVLLK